MTGRGSGGSIRRILVALDASSHSLAGLEAAAELATRLGAELLGLFVEDINLIRIADSPYAHQVGRFSARRREISSVEVERELKTQAAWAQGALQRIAESNDLAWSFRVVRGLIPQELIAATEETDIIILGKTGWSEIGGVGSTAHAILTQASKLTLILRHGIQLGVTIMVIYDGSDCAREALSLAGQLAQSKRDRLIVLLVAENKPGSLSLESDVTKWAQEQELTIDFQWITEASAFMVCSIAKTGQSGILVVPKDAPALSDDVVMKILNDIDCPVLIVRQPGS